MQSTLTCVITIIFINPNLQTQFKQGPKSQYRHEEGLGWSRCTFLFFFLSFLPGVTAPVESAAEVHNMSLHLFMLWFFLPRYTLCSNDPIKTRGAFTVKSSFLLCYYAASKHDIHAYCCQINIRGVYLYTRLRLCRYLLCCVLVLSTF